MISSAVLIRQSFEKHYIPFLSFLSSRVSLTGVRSIGHWSFRPITFSAPMYVLSCALAQSYLHSLFIKDSGFLSSLKRNTGDKDRLLLCIEEVCQ